MKALLYHGPAKKAWEEVPDPVVATRQIDAARLATHRFGLSEFLDAYDVFGRASDTGALKVVVSR